ncbi:MAG: hypothetical protein KF862_01450 [Chitinophagaceae bacterium]|nr:hypothetical protein [Chitinophagaceae bacterium]
MISRFNAKHLILCLSLSVFFSCKKDDNPGPTPPPQEEPTLFEKVQGRWDAEVDLPVRISNPAVSYKNQDMPHVRSVEFLSDSTYIVAFAHGGAFTGKLSVIDSASFNFTGLGEVSNIQIKDDSLSFTWSYNDIPLNVRAGKVSDLSISADKKAILKSWVLSTEEDGADLYEEFNIEEGKKITMLFSSAGTLLTKYSDVANARNWKWHPEKANAALFYSPGQTEFNYDIYYKLAELTNTGLKIQLVHVDKEYDDDDNVISEEEVVDKTFILTAE